MKCKAKNKQGKQCGAYAMSGNEYCYLHNPNITDKEKRAVKVKGGQANRAIITKPLPPIEIKAPQDVVGLLANTINQVRAGGLDVRIANCIGVLSGHLIKALEVANIEHRVEMVERVILEKRTKNY